jgi:O-antigen biosynthesis protein
MSKLSVGILTIDPFYCACPYIRLISPLRDLVEKGLIELHTICAVDNDKVKISYEIARNLDVIIVQRQFCAMISHTQLMMKLGNVRPKIVFEIDDALTMLPHSHIGYRSSLVISPMIEEYIKNADLVTVSTSKLKTYFDHLNKNIKVLSNCLDMKLWSNLGKPVKACSSTNILFSGTITHDSDLKIIENAIEKIILEFGDAVKFLFWGNTSAILKQYSQAEELHVFTADYAEYSARLKNADVDFAIIPLEDNLFNRAKSSIKWLEYSACGIPGIYSNIEAYNTVVQNGKTGVLVENTINDWYQAIKKFIIDSSYRNEIAYNAQAAVLLKHTVDLNSLKWLETYRKMFSMVSIIIPVFNKCEYTRNCLASLKKFPPSGHYEIIIINNGSTDDTDDFLKSINDPLIKVIVNPANLGFATACNQGARAASYNYLLFLNNDTEANFNWLRPLLTILDKDNSVAAVGSKLIYPDGTIQHAGVIIADDKSIGDPLLGRHAYCKQRSDLPEANQCRVYQALTAACILIRKHAFENVGGFDEEYWNGYEDIDLCFKLQKNNWKLIYQPESVVIHYESQSGEERFTKVKQNILRLHRKWLGKIKPDMIIQKDGSAFLTNKGRIQLYEAPTDELSVLSKFPNGGHKNMVSIIILTFNQLNYTKECIESIQKNTPETHEIIFVDNGSNDGTVKWLKNVVKYRSNYKLIENKTNLGFAKGCNQGIKLSTGENLMLLNNDVVVTRNWLAGMLECLNSALDIGIVGPMTNHISGIQKVPVVDYSSIKEVELYARKFRECNRYRWISTKRIVGFCMLFKRHLSEQIGLLDESFGSGNFEDDDYCLRASLSGYRNMIAGDVFVHHHGSRTFIGNKMDYGNLLYGNRRIFIDKWSRTGIVGQYGKQILVQNTISKAEELYRQGKMDKAIAVLVDNIINAPGEKDYYFFFVEMLIDAKRYKDALGILEAMKMDDTDAKKIVLMGHCQQGMGNNDTAEKYADQALSLEPSLAQALNIKGISAYHNRKIHAAYEFFQKAIESVPGFGESYTNLGVLKWESCEHKEAVELFERGFILSPTSMDVVTAYYSVVCEINRFSKAESVFREARAMFPNDKRIAIFLIDLLVRQEKYNVAIHEIEQAMILFGIDEELLLVALDIRNKIGPIEKSNKDANRNTISLCMIVKNEEKHLAKSLTSVKPVVDEMIVVDTGSSDQTRDIAIAFGAKMFDFKWQNDFSQARNFSLSKATGDWILVLDADEIISALDHKKLRQLIDNNAQKRVAYTMVTRNYTNQAGSRGWAENEGIYFHEEAGRGWVPSPKVRLFINDKQIKFVNPVHELVEPTLEKLAIKIATCDIPVHHYGRLNQDKVIAKGKEYYRLGINKIEKTNGDCNALRELAIQASEIGNYEEAVKIWQKLIELKSNDAGAFMNMGYAYLTMKQYDKAVEHSKMAMDLDPGLREAALNYSAAELIAGDVKKAISTLESILKNNFDYPPAMGRLAAAYMIDGRKEEGMKYLDRLNTKGFDCSCMLEEQSRAFFAEGKNEQAVVLLQAAIEKAIANGSIHALLAECQQKMIKCSAPVPGPVDSSCMMPVPPSRLEIINCTS